MTVEFQYADPEPDPLAGLQEIHMDPNTGENERALSLAAVGGLDAQQRSALPVSALPDGWERTSRNAACPCGSGKKFKHCHGSLV